MFIIKCSLWLKPAICFVTNPSPKAWVNETHYCRGFSQSFIRYFMLPLKQKDEVLATQQVMPQRTKAGIKSPHPLKGSF